jgi:hypothetical protein
MAKAFKGNPDLDRDVVQRFVQARDALAVAVADVLGDENIVRNLGQDTLDRIETSLRETRIAVDRGLPVFARWRTVRSRQSVGGALASISKRVADLEETVTTPGSGPKAEPAEPQGHPVPDPGEGGVDVQPVEEVVTE